MWQRNWEKRHIIAAAQIIHIQDWKNPRPHQKWLASWQPDNYQHRGQNKMCSLWHVSRYLGAKEAIGHIEPALMEMYLVSLFNWDRELSHSYVWAFKLDADTARDANSSTDLISSRRVQTNSSNLSLKISTPISSFQGIIGIITKKKGHFGWKANIKFGFLLSISMNIESQMENFHSFTQNLN